MSSSSGSNLISCAKEAWFSVYTSTTHTLKADIALRHLRRNGHLDDNGFVQIKAAVAQGLNEDDVFKCLEDLSAALATFRNDENDCAFAEMADRTYPRTRTCSEVQPFNFRPRPRDTLCRLDLQIQPAFSRPPSNMMSQPPRSDRLSRPLPGNDKALSECRWTSDMSADTTTIGVLEMENTPETKADVSIGAYSVTHQRLNND